MLYIVPTPIGNLEDITLRAIRILKEVDSIIAEDTRTSSVLLKHLEISKPMSSFHKFNEHDAVAVIVQKLIQGENIALISDAGTPSISDPGFLLVREAVAADVKIECLPGATAFTPALVCSGLPCDKFCFEGFLPVKKGRQTRLKFLAEEQRTIIFYESPHRLVKTLEQFGEFIGGQRRVCVSREISKKFEEHARGTVDEMVKYFKEKEPRGEIVICLQGKD